MHLLLLCVMLQRVALADDLPPVSQYVGEAVTLRSGADPSWKLNTITWSIWTNTSWIATYINTEVRLDHFYKYNGRLHLNTSTGDLEIRNLKADDGLEYTVDFSNSEGDNKVNKIKLNIKQRLSKPVIQPMNEPRLSPGSNICVLGLHCSSPDPGVTLSWNSDPHFTNYTQINNNNLLAILNQTQGTVKFTCVSRKNGDNNTETFSTKCEEAPPPVICPAPVKPPESNCKGISRDPVFLVPGLLFGAVVALICWCYYKKQKNKRVSNHV